MKNTISLILFLGCIHIHAQEYTPFPKENARWAYYFEMEGWQNWTLYYMNGDTTDNQNTFQVINRRRWYNYSSSPTILSNIYIREADKKIYFKDSLNMEEEILIYDFNLTVGDTFFINFSNEPDTFKIINDYYEDSRRKLELESLREKYLGSKIYDTWIEGMGSTSDLLVPVLFSSLRCFEDDNEYSENCNFIDKILTVSEPKVVQSKNLIYPNPTCDLLYFQFDNNNYKKYNLYDSSGNLICSDKIVENHINVSDLPSGIYLIQFIGDGLLINNRFGKFNNR